MAKKKKVASSAIRRKGEKKVAKKLVKKQSTHVQKSGVYPLGNRALIRPFTKDELETKNSFGIILPDSGKKEKAEQGTVLAVGAGVYQDGKLIPMSVNVGDVVAFSKYGYDDITFQGEELYLIKDENILAILRK